MIERRAVHKKIVSNFKLNPDSSGIPYKEYGKSINPKEYKDDEIIAMYCGFYSHQNIVMLEDIPVKLDGSEEIICKLEQVTFHNKSKVDKLGEWASGNFGIKNVRTFYVSDYILKKEDDEYNLSRILVKAGGIKKGRGQYLRYYSVGNYDKTFKSFTQGKYPTDLFHPIKRYFNSNVSVDDYFIRNFRVESDITFYNDH